MNKRAQPGSMRYRVIEACRTPAGMTVPDIVAALAGEKRTVVWAMITSCVKAGDIFKAGVFKHCRYYTSKEHAEAFELIAPQYYERQKQEKAAEKLAKLVAYKEARYAKLRAERAAARAARLAAKPPKPPKPPKVAKPAKPPKAKAAKSPKLFDPTNAFVPVPLQRRGEQKVPARHSFNKETTVTWPEHVKVTVIPTPEDTRFKFIPPKGWKGEITKDRLRESREALKGKAR